jgi:hypothetical protein
VYNTNVVNAFQFNKPVQIHAIKHSTHFLALVAKILKCYKGAFDESNVYKKPFMVFVTKVFVAELLVQLLQRTCYEMFSDNECTKVRTR